MQDCKGVKIPMPSHLCTAENGIDFDQKVYCSMIGSLNGIFISQDKYLKDVLRKFGMQDCKGVKIPMPSHLCTAENGIDFDQKVYCSMIGSLLYLCASRPDIMLSVSMCARFQAAPKESHHLAVKRILRYLAYTPTLGL